MRSGDGNRKDRDMKTSSACAFILGPGGKKPSPATVQAILSNFPAEVFEEMRGGGRAACKLPPGVSPLEILAAIAFLRHAAAILSGDFTKMMETSVELSVTWNPIEACSGAGVGCEGCRLRGETNPQKMN